MNHGEDHWSIGEVLSLLQDEFPEVTISKIRFLESQGLINPERTPSGYRRFYQGDFDRLQWILGQQRDHYLPLKVIRDRLESGDFESESELEPAVVGAAAAETAAEGGDDIVVTSTAAGAGGPGPDVAGSGSAGSGSAEAESAGAESAGGDADISVTPSAAEERAVTNGSGPPSETAGEPVEAEDDQAVDPVDAKVAAIEAVTRPVTERRGRSDGTSADADLNMALTLDELADASGCDSTTLRELERFGLLVGRQIGPTVLFDGEALLIARLAAQFQSFGLDPRHLRTLKLGAEREVSLLSQVVEPILHRRDAETRRKAIETLDDLVDLSASFRAILVRQMVREHLPSQRG